MRLKIQKKSYLRRLTRNFVLFKLKELIKEVKALMETLPTMTGLFKYELIGVVLVNQEWPN